MQERKKKRIVLASVLKPIDDTRMFEKMGISLAEAGYEVHIVGFPSKAKPNYPAIQFHASSFFSRISVRRAVAGFSILKKCLALQPDVLIVGTHELLGCALLVKLIIKARIIYDIRENHFYNIRYTSTFPMAVRGFLAYVVRIKEQCMAPFIDHFILAERGYEKELPFLSKHTTTLENKFRRSLIAEKNKHAGYTKLLFTGTIAETTGIFEVIDLVKNLHKADSSISLTIIGYAAQKDVLNKVLIEIQSHPFIRLIGGNALVPHAEIVAQIVRADFGFVWYPKNKSTASSIPTKFYEYSALGLPILTPQNQSVANTVEIGGYGIVFSSHEDDKKLLSKMKEFYPATEQTETLYWENEEQKLLHTVEGN